MVARHMSSLGRSGGDCVEGRGSDGDMVTLGDTVIPFWHFVWCTRKPTYRVTFNSKVTRYVGFRTIGSDFGGKVIFLRLPRGEDWF